MEIKEIDPEEAMFLNLKQEGLSGKLQGFLQIRNRQEHPPYHPPPKPIQKPSQIASVAIKPRIQPLVHLPAQLPKETIVLDDDLEDMIRAGPPYIREPVIQGNAIAGNAASPQMMFPPVPAPQPMAAADLDVAEIYGTGRGIALPKFKLPSFRRKTPDYSDTLREDVKPAFNWKGLILLLNQVIAGIVLVYLGLTTTGSYYQPVSRYTGQMAMVFYQYQLGVLVVIVGCFLVYHAFGRAGKL